MNYNWYQFFQTNSTILNFLLDYIPFDFKQFSNKILIGYFFMSRFQVQISLIYVWLIELNRTVRSVLIQRKILIYVSYLKTMVRCNCT